MLEWFKPKKKDVVEESPRVEVPVPDSSSVSKKIEKSHFSIQEIAAAKRDIEDLLEKRNTLRLEIINTEHTAKNTLNVDLAKKINSEEFAGEAITGEKFEKSHELNREIKSISDKYGFDLARIELPYNKMDVENQEVQMKKNYPKFHREEIRPSILEAFKTQEILPYALSDSDEISLYSDKIKKGDIIVESRVPKGELPDSALSAVFEMVKELGIPVDRTVSWKNLRQEINEALEKRIRENKSNKKEWADYQSITNHIVEYADANARKQRELNGD